MRLRKPRTARSATLQRDGDIVHTRPGAIAPEVQGKFVKSAVAVLSKIAAVDEDGNSHIVEKYTVEHRIPGAAKVRLVPMYRLSTGEQVSLVGAGAFVVAATGMRLVARG